MDYYNKIKNELINNEINRKVKDYSKNKGDLETYYNVGKMLTEAESHYGDNIIESYSKKLMSDVGKKYNRRTLFRMRQFYQIFKNEKVSPLATQLSWSHYVELLPLKDVNKVYYYISICETLNLTRDELRERIKSKEYDRLDDNTKNKLIEIKKQVLKILLRIQ